MPNLLQRRRTVLAVVLALAVAYLVLPWPTVASSAGAEASDSFDLARAGGVSDTRYLSGLQRAEERPRGARIQGMEGLGDTVLTLQNRAARDTDVDLWLQKLGKQDVHMKETVAPGDGWSLDFDAMNELEPGFYSAVVESESPLNILAKTQWHTGATASFEAARSSTSLILPLMMRDVYGHATIFRVMNPAEGGDPALMTVSVYHSQSGQQLSEVMANIRPGETLLFDSLFESTFNALPEVAGGGFVGSVRIESDQPLAVTAYGDEMVGDGASGYVAVPMELADTELFLPSVRTNYLGDSLISLVNPSDEVPVQVTLNYSGVLGDSEDIQAKQVVTISRQGTTLIDLAARGRGRPGPMELSGGRRDNVGFWGHVVLTATGPIVAAVHEEVRLKNRVRAISAYNAFDDSSFGRSFSVPFDSGGAKGRTAQVVIQNTGVSADVQLSYRDESGALVSSDRIRIGEKDHVVAIPSSKVPGGGRLDISSAQRLAVLVQETSLLEIGDWKDTMVDHTAYRVYPNVRASAPADPPPPTATPTPEPTATPTPIPTEVGPTPSPPPTAPVNPPTATETKPNDGVPIFLPKAFG